MAKQMEQFEKWWRKNKGWLECIDSFANYDAKVTAKIVWKAAFKLIRETHENYSITEVLRLVGKELKDEQKS